MQHIVVWFLAYGFMVHQSVVYAASYPLPGPHDAITGRQQQIFTKFEDDFAELAQRYDVGFLALSAANPDLNPSLPGEGSLLNIPSLYLLPATPRRGIVVNLAELRLYYFPENQQTVYTFPIGIGKEGWDTPLGTTRISSIVKKPTWTPPPSIVAEYQQSGVSLPRVVPAGPGNPLGDLALRLELPGYLLHGTDNEAGVGFRVSHGCLRLRNRDIETLASIVKVGTPVTIVNQPYKIGWHNKNLYLEAHRPLSDRYNDAELDRQSIRTELGKMLRSEALKAGVKLNTKDLIERALAVDNIYSGMPMLLMPAPEAIQ